MSVVDSAMLLIVLHVNGSPTLLYRKNFPKTRYVNLDTCALAYITRKNNAREVSTDIVGIAEKGLLGHFFEKFSTLR